MSSNAAMREALIAAGVMPRARKPKFKSFREYFANTDMADELKKSGMPKDKQMALEDFRDSQQIVDFANLTRNRLYQANSTNHLQTEYIKLLESQLLRNGIQLPNKTLNTSGVNDETIANKSC